MNVLYRNLIFWWTETEHSKEIFQFIPFSKGEINNRPLPSEVELTVRQFSVWRLGSCHVSDSRKLVVGIYADNIFVKKITLSDKASRSFPSQSPWKPAAVLMRKFLDSSFSQQITMPNCCPLGSPCPRKCISLRRSSMSSHRLSQCLPSGSALSMSLRVAVR